MMSDNTKFNRDLVMSFNPLHSSDEDLKAYSIAPLLILSLYQLNYEKK